MLYNVFGVSTVDIGVDVGATDASIVLLLFPLLLLILLDFDLCS